jgi:hypothetical protein
MQVGIWAWLHGWDLIYKDDELDAVERMVERKLLNPGGIVELRTRAALTAGQSCVRAVRSEAGGDDHSRPY